jgi:myo-inositol-1-phosphate synthase
MKAAFDRNYVKRLDGRTSKKPRTNTIWRCKSRTTSHASRKQNKVSAPGGGIWCGSTEIFLKPQEVHSTAAKFEEA